MSFTKNMTFANDIVTKGHGEELKVETKKGSVFTDRIRS
jgi:hypothetical protein